MPVEALKNTTGAPEGTGSRRATSRATLATLRLLSLRTSPRLMRWVKNSRNMRIGNRYSSFMDSDMSTSYEGKSSRTEWSAPGSF